MTRHAGFTLIEVMVAIVLMAIVSLLSWRGLDAVVHASERTEDDAERTQAVLRAVGQLTRDLQQRAPAGVLAGAPLPAGVPRPVAVLPEAIGYAVSSTGQRTLTLVRAAPGQAGAWQEVSWSVEHGVLRRRVGRASATLPLPKPQAAVDVLDGVRALQVRAWVPARGWVDLPAPAGTRAATGLELSIQRAGAEVYRRLVVFE